MAALQLELHTDVAPPQDACDWPQELLWDWMAGGGELSVAALAAASFASDPAADIRGACHAVGGERPNDRTD